MYTNSQAPQGLPGKFTIRDIPASVIQAIDVPGSLHPASVPHAHLPHAQVAWDDLCFSYWPLTDRRATDPDSRARAWKQALVEYLESEFLARPSQAVIKRQEKELERLRAGLIEAMRPLIGRGFGAVARELTDALYRAMPDNGIEDSWPEPGEWGGWAVGGTQKKKKVERHLSLVGVNENEEN